MRLTGEDRGFRSGESDSARTWGQGGTEEHPRGTVTKSVPGPAALALKRRGQYTEARAASPRASAGSAKQGARGQATRRIRLPGFLSPGLCSGNCNHPSSGKVLHTMLGTEQTLAQ